MLRLADPMLNLAGPLQHPAGPMLQPAGPNSHLAGPMLHSAGPMLPQLNLTLLRTECQSLGLTLLSARSGLGWFGISPFLSGTMLEEP